ncbi:hypothetical protein PAE9249_05344 [Paenibacillus sp. CECT 9249]|nr:hypothetical protein PAE9249_05344 [Paenibacillus sp. CECT 9249]
MKPLKVLNAADFGVPQNRERLFVLGSRKDIDCKLEYPQPTHISPKSATYKYDPVNKNHSSRDEVGGMRYCPTVADAIGDLPNPELFKELIEQDSIPYTNNVKYISEFAKIMRGQTVVLDDYSTIPPNWDSRIITNFKRTKHDDRIKKEFQVLKEGEAHHSRRRKLSAKGLSPTIRAGTKSDKGSYTALRPIHYEQPRVITVREAARLMSFPDWMYFHHTKWHGFRLVGNAVPPLLAKAVALQVRREILKIKELEVTQNAKA